MIRRSVFLSLAAGLLTGSAFGTLSQASGSLVAVQSILNPLPAGDTISPVDFTYNAAAKRAHGVVGEAFVGLTVEIPSSLAGSREATSDTFVMAAGDLSGPSAGISHSTGAASEPASMSLLGIGMVGFFTYRRLFKRLTAA